MVTKATRAGLLFQPTKIKHHIATIISGNPKGVRLTAGSYIYLTAVIEYLIAEILELSGNVARDNKKQIITREHINMAIKEDEELSIIYNKCIVSGIFDGSLKYDAKYHYNEKIYGVLKQVHPNLSLATYSRHYFNKLIEYTLEMFACVISSVFNDKKTIDSRIIQTIVRLQLPNELSKHAVSEGCKAVTKYTSSKY